MAEWACPKCSFLATGFSCEICGYSLQSQHSKAKGKKRFVKIETDFFNMPSAVTVVQSTCPLYLCLLFNQEKATDSLSSSAVSTVNTNTTHASLDAHVEAVSNSADGTQSMFIILNEY